MNLLIQTHYYFTGANPNQVLQGVGALHLNMSWYGWYPEALYSNTKTLRCSDQLGFCSFGQVFSRFCRVQLNYSQGKLPQG